MSIMYDDSDPKSIENYAQKMVGKTFADLCDMQIENKTASRVSISTDYATSHADRKRKGGLGEIVEECFFGYKANSSPEADFPKAGVELKVTPFKVNKKGENVAKERLVITMIDYFEDIKYEFYDSHLWKKAHKILLVYYQYEQDKLNLSFVIKYTKLFTPDEVDLKIIQDDYNKIISKIKSGRAHELSEADTLYLGACTKATSSKDTREQPYNDILAKPRAFSYKNSYMTYVLNHYIIAKSKPFERILSAPTNLEFEEYVTEQISKYSGYYIDGLCRKFNIEFNKAQKDLGSIVAYNILGVKGNKAEELVKANIVVKTIRLSENGKIKESMSFPAFKFKELIEEEWETSTFGTYLNETRFLFIVYQFDKNERLFLKGCQFWNIPYHDLNVEVKSVWEKTKEVISEGLVINRVNGRNYTNLPKASENPVCHVRPHARNAEDTYDLPDGRKFPKQCFWLNNTYILSQLNDRLKIF